MTEVAVAPKTISFRDIADLAEYGAGSCPLCDGDIGYSGLGDAGDGWTSSPFYCTTEGCPFKGDSVSSQNAISLPDVLVQPDSSVSADHLEKDDVHQLAGEAIETSLKDTPNNLHAFLGVRIGQLIIKRAGEVSANGMAAQIAYLLDNFLSFDELESLLSDLDIELPTMGLEVTTE